VTPQVTPRIDLDDIRRAARRLQGVAHRTPVLTSRRMDEHLGAAVACKAEHLQRVGAFKFRGGYNAIAALEPAARARGILSFSSGNHAQAVACAAALLGAEATIVMPTDAPEVKLDATRGYGATVVPYDRYTEDRRAIVAELAERTGATVIPPYDDADVMAGQGTAALELIEDHGPLDVLVLPIGGGGLIAGCAVAARALLPDIRIIGVEPAGRYAARGALDAGAVVQVDVPTTIMDGQQTPEVGAGPLAVMQQHVHEVVGVQDSEVVAAMRLLAQATKQVIEPSGAAAFAAVLAGHVEVTGARVGVVLSGGNVAPARFAELLATG
jgi:threo-3-hydroxy-L-aspartate ammonia-lyase